MTEVKNNEKKISALAGAIKLVYQNETYMLDRLIRQHGELKGVEYFNYMKRESKDLLEEKENDK